MASLVCCKHCHWGLRGPLSLPPPPRTGAPSRLGCHKLPDSAGRIAACFSESKPDRLSAWGYHPLEELTAREGSAEPLGQSLELSNAEVARTVADVNWSAVVFASVGSQDTTILGTEVQYLIDENGDFYFEMDEEDHMLHNVGGFESHTVVIGIGNMDEIELSDLIGAVAVEEEDEDEDEDEDDSELDEDVGEEWELVGASDIEDLVQDWDNWGGDGAGSPWPAGTSEALENVHPLEFGTKVAEVATADHHKAIDKPTRHLTITGAVRRVTKEEEAYVQKKWFDRFFQDGEDADRDDEESSGSESDSEDEVASRIQDSASESCSLGSENGDSVVLDRCPDSQKGSPSGVDREKDMVSVNGMDLDASRLKGSSSSGGSSGSKDAVEAVEEPLQAGGKSLPAVDKAAKKKLQLLEGPTAKKPNDDPSADSGEQSDTESCYYKLEIIRIQLDSTSGLQLPVDVKEFQDAKPDVLAHSAPLIIQRVNNGGQKTEGALKALCKREKGLKVEEASLVGVDCLGVDLRIQSGIELKTLRFPFSKRAISEEMAEVLLEKMLFP